MLNNIIEGMDIMWFRKCSNIDTMLATCIEEQKCKINVLEKMLLNDLKKEDKQMFDNALHDVDLFEAWLCSKVRQLVKDSVCNSANGIYRKE